MVCFDATYLTNDYALSFVKFVGVNHHGQSFLFGCALVSHEDAETYAWVFSTWLMCMGGKAPTGFYFDISRRSNEEGNEACNAKYFPSVVYMAHSLKVVCMLDIKILTMFSLKPFMKVFRRRNSTCTGVVRLWSLSWEEKSG